MKQVFSRIIICVIALCIVSNVALAENKNTKKFDASWFEDLGDYEYDKFDKKWSSWTYAIEKTSAMTLFVQGNSDCVFGGPYFGFGGIKNGEVESVSGADILIDDVLYTYPTLSVGDCALIIEEEKEILVALSQASNVSIRVHLQDGGTSSDDLSGENLANIRITALKLLDMNVWQYVVDDNRSKTIKESGVGLHYEKKE